MQNPKTILITGASSGIGEALAIAYAKSGVTLLLTGRSEERLDKVADACRQQGANVVSAAIDIKDSQKLAVWIEEQDKVMPLDLVIANAGISSSGQETTPEFDKEIFTINLFGVLNTVYPVIPLMKQRKRGQIVLMGSLAGMYGFPRAPAYCASKAAVRTFGESLRNKLRPLGIEITVICPGFIKTPLTDVNEYKMPFLMPVERAVNIIIKGLARNKGLIAFPWQMYFALWWLRVLPSSLAERLAQHIT